jgi:hypothetical protein
LAGRFLDQLLGGQLAELVVDQRQELLGGVRVALLDGGQDLGNVTHGGTNAPWLGHFPRAGQRAPPGSVFFGLSGSLFAWRVNRGGL